MATRLGKEIARAQAPKKTETKPKPPTKRSSKTRTSPMWKDHELKTQLLMMKIKLESGKTNEQIAEALGVAPTQISNWYAGDPAMSAEKRQHIYLAALKAGLLTRPTPDNPQSMFRTHASDEDILAILQSPKSATALRSRVSAVVKEKRAFEKSKQRIIEALDAFRRLESGLRYGRGHVHRDNEEEENDIWREESALRIVLGGYRWTATHSLAQLLPRPTQAAAKRRPAKRRAEG